MSFEQSARKYFVDNLFGYISNKSDKLIISFAGLPGKPCFQLYGTINKLGYNGVFLCDTSRNWYQQGVTCIGNTIDETLKVLDELTSYFDDSNIYFIGGSMGGYAALLFASLLGKGNVLAFSPQTILKPHYGWYPESAVIEKYNDLSKLNFQNNRITVISSYLPIDVLSLRKIELVDSLKTDTYIIQSNEHNVAKLFKAMGILENFLSEYLNSGNILYLSKVNDRIYKDGIELSLFESFLDSYYQSNWIEAKSFTDKLSLVNLGYDCLKAFTAVVLLKNGLFVESYSIFEKIFAGNIHMEAKYKIYFLCLKMILSRNIVLSEEYIAYKKIANNKIAEADFYMAIATELSRLKKSSLAIDIRLECLKLDITEESKYASNLYQLGKLYFEEKVYESSIYYFSIRLGMKATEWEEQRIREFYFPFLLKKIGFTE